MVNLVQQTTSVNGRGIAASCQLVLSTGTRAGQVASKRWLIKLPALLLSMRSSTSQEITNNTHRIA
jgi:hypothetical protein